MAGLTFEDSILIRARPEELFALTQDYGRRLEWDPFLRVAELVGGATESGVGVRAWCVARNGLGMETEYVSYQPPRVTAVKMTRGPWIIESFAGSWRFEPQGDGVTRVQFRYQVRARPRWAARLLTPVFTRVFARDVRKRLEGLKRAVEEERILERPARALVKGG
jgi:ribosome-associated toxin RatA of RatAB toxin-antitoxin module